MNNSLENTIGSIALFICNKGYSVMRPTEDDAAIEDCIYAGQPANHLLMMQNNETNDILTLWSFRQNGINKLGFGSSDTLVINKDLFEIYQGCFSLDHNNDTDQTAKNILAQIENTAPFSKLSYNGYASID